MKVSGPKKSKKKEFFGVSTKLDLTSTEKKEKNEAEEEEQASFLESQAQKRTASFFEFLTRKKPAKTAKKVHYARITMDTHKTM